MDTLKCYTENRMIFIYKILKRMKAVDKDKASGLIKPMWLSSHSLEIWIASLHYYSVCLVHVVKRSWFWQ